MIPKDLLREAKLAAIDRQTSVSDLIKNGLKKEIHGDKKAEKKDNSILSLIGKRSIGINKFKREDIYDDYLRKKISR